MTNLREPWLVAAWPGMGAVALLAAEHLARKLGGERLMEIPAGEHFHPAGVSIQAGLVVPPRPPRTVCWGWRNPGTGRDLVILVGEQQPAADSWQYCKSALAFARELGVTRACTFAAMATPAAPMAAARVFVAATEDKLLSELQQLGAEKLTEGQIGGMNGLFLAAAAEQGIPGACLLGEIPFFASGVPNPKAAAAVLRLFARLVSIEVDVSELDRAGAEIEKQLAAHYAGIQQAAETIQEAVARKSGEEESGPPWPRSTPPEALSREDLARIEALFEETRRDRSMALELKAELDRLHVFRRYEDRFLDLFNHAE